MKHIYTWLLCSLASLPAIAFAQDAGYTNFIYRLDSVYTPISRLVETAPETISYLTIHKIAVFDSVDHKVKEGIVYAFTKRYVRDQYWRFFSSRSEAYKDLVPAPEADTNLHYILNGQVLEEGERGKFFNIMNDKSFRRLKIINSKQLLNKYHIRTQSMGVVVRAKIKKEK